MEKSIWVNNINQKFDDKIINDVDVLIIGGGITGVSAAYNLKDSKLNICLIEAQSIGMGSTSNTTGKITYLQDIIYQKLESMHDFETAKKYLESQIYARDIILNIIKDNNIECDLIKNESYIFSLNDKDKIKIEKEYKFLKENNLSSEIVDKLEIDFPCNYALKVKDTYVFNPIKYINELCNIIKDKIKICEKVRALTITKNDNYYIVNTNKGEIKAKYVLVCTQYPFFIVPGYIPFKTHIEKSHVIASKIDKIKNFNAISVGDEIYSIRYHKDKNSYIIFAGESYKMSNHIDYEKRQKELNIKFKENFQTKIDYQWSTHDITSNDLLPIIGSIDTNLLIATAFNKWGMTNGVLSGKILSDIVLNTNNDYIPLFDPKRKITLKRSINFLVDTFNISKIYISTKLNKNKKFYNDRVRFINMNGKSYGVYTDKNGKKHTIRNVCPHMKCSLLFNFMDKTWDCPCHGSRFDLDGNIIKGPSSYDIKVDTEK